MLLRDLFESFNNPLPLRWEDRSNEDLDLLVANFAVGKGHFEVRFGHKHYNPGLWEFDFHDFLHDGFKLTGTGNAVTVLATVLAAVREFIQQYEPRFFVFSADKAEPSRDRLYPKLAALIQQEFPAYQKTMDTRRTRKGAYSEYSFERPRKEFTPPPKPEPEPYRPMTPEEQQEIEALLAELGHSPTDRTSPAHP